LAAAVAVIVAVSTAAVGRPAGDHGIARNVSVKRNKFIHLSSGIRSVNRELEAKARALAGIKGRIINQGGAERPVRMSGVLVREHGQWVIA
jgi:hypothetical protein